MTFTPKELEILRRRINEPDWDSSEMNDLWKLLPKLLELAKGKSCILANKHDYFRALEYNFCPMCGEKVR